MQTNELKDNIQQQALELSKLHNHLLIEFATGLGKTLTAIRIIEYHGGKWNIILAETNHEQNWIDEFKKYNKEYLLKDVKFFCYQSLHKYTEEENYIADEIHHMFSEKRVNLLQQIYLTNLTRLIGLSATLTRTQHGVLKDILGEYYTFKISLSDAIDQGILPEPELYFVGIELNNIQRIHKFHFNKEKWVMCTEQEMYDRMTQKVDWLKDRYMTSRDAFHKIRWLKSANDRKKFLSKCKTKHTKTILDKLKDKRLVCFTGSIEQSEELSGGYSIHSKLHKDTRKQLIQDFNSGKSSKLFATQMLKEGMNLTNIEVGIIVQLDNVERYLIQILGRTLRALAPIQYVLYVKNTQDEKYVENVTINFNKDYIKFIDIENLTIS